MSGFFRIIIELNPENNSGSEVTAAISINPIQAFPSPLRSAIISPYFDSLTPEKTINRAQDINPPSVSIIGFNAIINSMILFMIRRQIMIIYLLSLYFKNFISDIANRY